MSKLNNPEAQDDVILINAREKLSRINVEDSQSIINHILIETAEQCISYIAKDVRNAYCQSEKLFMMPSELADLVRERAATLYIQYSLSVHKNLEKLYSIQTYAQSGGGHDQR